MRLLGQPLNKFILLIQLRWIENLTLIGSVRGGLIIFSVHIFFKTNHSSILSSFRPIQTASNYAQENLLTMVKKSLDELIVGNSLNQCKTLNVETISKILTEQILKLDATLCDRLRNSRDIAGTTALIALRIVQTNELVVANIGDSRGVLCDSKGNAIGKRF